jgi:hypothetical protein
MEKGKQELPYESSSMAVEERKISSAQLHTLVAGSAAAGLGCGLREVRPTGHNRWSTHPVIRADGELVTPPLGGNNDA